MRETKYRVNCSNFNKKNGLIPHDETAETCMHNHLTEHNSCLSTPSRRRTINYRKQAD